MNFKNSYFFIENSIIYTKLQILYNYIKYILCLRGLIVKKLLSFFAALSIVSMSSLSVISCDNTAEIIKNKIDNAKSITIRGDNLSYDLNDYLTKKTIFNELNLTSFEQKYIINLKGSISSRKITFDISSNPNTSVEKYTASIKLNDSKIEAINNTKPTVQPDFNLANAKNIAILNNRQISISGASNSAQVSDDNLNLNTNKSYELIDNLSTPPSFVTFFGDYYYTVNNSLVLFFASLYLKPANMCIVKRFW